MLDITYIRDNREQVAAAARNKNIEVDLDKLFNLDEQRRDLTQTADNLRQQRNQHADSIKGGKPSQEQIEAGKQIKESLMRVEGELTPVETEFTELLKQVPNVPSDDTPIGKTEEENQVVFEWGDKPKFDFEPKNHWEIAQLSGWIDKERAAKVSGARFAFLLGPLVELQLAIEQLTIKILSSPDTLQQIIDEFEVKNVGNKAFMPVLPPHLIKTEVFAAMDRLEPRDDRYKIEGEELWLQGSAEHVLGSMYQDEIIDEADLPLRLVGFATSFRKEAGSYGKDMEGIIRMHQFDKLEMEILSVPEYGLSEHLLTIAIQEHLLRTLELPYQKLLKCTADIGKPNARGVDMNVWLPGQNQYRETHTADFMTDYQARRLQTRVRRSDGSIDFVHTIDATAFALGRTMVAIMENYQTNNGQVRVPEVLQPYLNKEVL